MDHARVYRCNNCLAMSPFNFCWRRQAPRICHGCIHDASDYIGRHPHSPLCCRCLNPAIFFCQQENLQLCVRCFVGKIPFCFRERHRVRTIPISAHEVCYHPNQVLPGGGLGPGGDEEPPHRRRRISGPQTLPQGQPQHLPQEGAHPQPQGQPDVGLRLGPSLPGGSGNMNSEEEKDLVQQVPSNLPSSSTASEAKYRHQYYQRPEEVVVTIFANGIPKQNVDIAFGEQILSVVIDVPGEEAYHLHPRLFGKIIPEKCGYEVMSTGIEIRLTKADIITWASLEHGKGSAVLPKASVSSEVSQRPAHPSDWDKLEAETKKQEKDEKQDGDAAWNKFSREMNADDEVNYEQINRGIKRNSGWD